MLAAAFVVFQTEVGIGGDILTRSYGLYGFLASHGFFKNLWQLLSWYGVSLRMPQSADIPLLWVNDRPLMHAVTATGIHTPAELIEINWFQHYKCVYLVADMVCCDGLTIKPSMLMMTAGASSRQFPLHQPVQSNLALWKRAVGSITVLGARLRIPLGAFVGIPHRPYVWFTNADSSYIYHMPVTSPSAVYEQPWAGRTTRFGSTYILSDAVSVPPEAMHRVSIRSWNVLSLRFHSSCPWWVPRAMHVPLTLLNNLAAWGNQSIWSTLRIDGDNCTWIFQGLMHGSLIIGHDGLYIPQVGNDVCTCAAVFYCTHEDKYADVTWAEKSSKLLANNYWAEILGDCCAQLIVKATIAGRNVLDSPIPHFCCDNMGVVLHGNDSRHPLLEKQAQADVLQYFKQLIL
jgi:hypothetical protein